MLLTNAWIATNLAKVEIFYWSNIKKKCLSEEKEIERKTKDENLQSNEKY
jgi:hypothetical protein